MDSPERDRVTEIITLRVTAPQREVLARTARARRCSEAAVVRDLLRGLAAQAACEGGKEAAGRAWCDCTRCRAIHEGRG